MEMHDNGWWGLFPVPPLGRRISLRRADGWRFHHHRHHRLQHHQHRHTKNNNNNNNKTQPRWSAPCSILFRYCHETCRAKLLPTEPTA